MSCSSTKRPDSNHSNSGSPPNTPLHMTIQPIGKGTNVSSLIHRPATLISRTELAAEARQSTPPVQLWSDLPAFNELVGPIVPNLYVLLGAMGSGKTALATSIARGLLTQGKGLVVPSELRPGDWEDRLLASLTRIPARKITLDDLSPDQSKLVEAARRDVDKPFGVQYLHSTAPTVKEIYELARTIPDLRWIIVDSASNIDGEGRGAYEQSTAIANGLLDIMLELGVPIIITVQTNDGPTFRPRGKKMPQLPDLYGTRKFGHHAAVVLGLYCHDYYVRKRLEKPDALFPRGTTRLYLLKHRDADEGEPNYRDFRFLGGCGIYTLES